MSNLRPSVNENESLVEYRENMSRQTVCIFSSVLVESNVTLFSRKHTFVTYMRKSLNPSNSPFSCQSHG
jgi:hypothetical protein